VWSSGHLTLHRFAFFGRNNYTPAVKQSPSNTRPQADLSFDEIMRRALSIKPDKPKKGSRPKKAKGRKK
jgi:hypothetical protein